MAKSLILLPPDEPARPKRSFLGMRGSEEKASKAANASQRRRMADACAVNRFEGWKPSGSLVACSSLMCERHSRGGEDGTRETEVGRGSVIRIECHRGRPRDLPPTCRLLQRMASVFVSGTLSQETDHLDSVQNSQKSSISSPIGSRDIICLWQ